MSVIERNSDNSFGKKNFKSFCDSFAKGYHMLQSLRLGVVTVSVTHLWTEPLGSCACIVSCISDSDFSLCATIYFYYCTYENSSNGNHTHYYPR